MAKSCEIKKTQQLSEDFETHTKPSSIQHPPVNWGASMSHALLSVLRQCPEELQSLSSRNFTGFSEEIVCKAAEALSAMVGPDQPSPLRVQLLAAMLSASRDPEKYVKEWL